MSRATVIAIADSDVRTTSAHATPEVPEGASLALARVGAPGLAFMPCVVGISSDIAIRLWCTRQVAQALTRGGRGFVTAERLPELTVRTCLPLGDRVVTNVARCAVTVARTSNDGGFVLDLAVREVGLDDQAI